MHALEFSPNVSHRKASAELGYSPRSIRQTIADIYAWFDENPPSRS